MKTIHLALYSLIFFLTALLLIPSTVLAQDTPNPNASSVENDNSVKNAPVQSFDTYNKNHLIELTIGTSGTHQNGGSNAYHFGEVYDIALNYKHPLSSFYRMGGGLDVARNQGHADWIGITVGFNWLHEFILYHSPLFSFSLEALVGYLIMEHKDDGLLSGPHAAKEGPFHGFQLGLKANFNWRLHPLFSLGFSVGIKESLILQIPYYVGSPGNSYVLMETLALHAIFHI